MTIVMRADSRARLMMTVAPGSLSGQLNTHTGFVLMGDISVLLGLLAKPHTVKNNAFTINVSTSHYQFNHRLPTS